MSKMSKINNEVFFIVTFSVIFLILQPAAFGAENNSLDFPIGLKIGETASINSELKMTLLDIEDSRCPSNVVCIWQGTVFVKIQLEKGNQDLGIHTIPMETMEDNKQTFDGYYIRLTNVEPYPINTMSIQPTDYVLTFFVSIAETNPVDSPLNQFNNGVPFNKIKCSHSLQLTQRYDGKPACVSSQTYFELIKRDWVSDIIKAVQSEDFFDPNQDQIIIQPVIKTGTNSGFCLGYCSKEFIITPEKIIYTQSGREVPDKIKHIPFSKASWIELTALVDFQKFNSLPNRIGCPGCADAPVEWIEIEYGDKTKKIEFEKGDNIPEIKKLILALQKIRSPIEFSIENFEGCVAAGNPIMESYPRQCKTSDGRNFVEKISSLEVKINGEKQVRRGTTQTLEIQVLRDEMPIERAKVFIDIEDYGEDIIKEFEGYTNSQGIFVFSWEIPKRFDDLETLLAIVDVTDNISSKTVLFKFQVYCLPGERDCKVEGN